jgi:hypothetical protein
LTRVAFDLGVQSLEAPLPEGAIAAQPAVQLLERLEPQRVHATLRVRADPDESGLAKDTKVSRDSRPRDRQHRGQLAGSRLTSPQRLKDLSAMGVGQRLQHGIHEV